MNYSKLYQYRNVVKQSAFNYSGELALKLNDGTQYDISSPVNTPEHATVNSDILVISDTLDNIKGENMKFRLAFKVHKNAIGTGTRYLVEMPGLALIKSDMNTLAIKTAWDNYWRYVPTTSIVNGWNEVELLGNGNKITLAVNTNTYLIVKDNYKSGVYYSDFYASRYLRIPKYYRLVEPWELLVVFESPSSLSRSNLLVGPQSGYQNGGYGLEINSGSGYKMGNGLSSSGSSWESWINGNITIQPSTKYWYRSSMDLNYVFRTEISTDGINYTQDVTHEFGRSIYKSGTEYMQIGNTDSSYDRYFTGSVYYSECYCKSGDGYYFNGATDVKGTDYIVVGDLVETPWESGQKYPTISTGTLKVYQSWIYVKDVEALKLED